MLLFFYNGKMHPSTFEKFFVHMCLSSLYVSFLKTKCCATFAVNLFAYVFQLLIVYSGIYYGVLEYTNSLLVY